MTGILKRIMTLGKKRNSQSRNLFNTSASDKKGNFYDRNMETCWPFKSKIALTISYIILVLASSAIPMDRQIQGFQFIVDIKPVIQNLLHIPMFAVLAILFLQILKNYQIKGFKRIVLVLLCSVFFGIISEAIQIVIPGRYGD